MRRSLFYKRKAEPADVPLAACIEKHDHQRVRFGWRWLLILVRRELAGIGEAPFRRLYRTLGLQVRPRKRPQVCYVRGTAIPAVSLPNDRWSIDFMRDRLGAGRTFRTMNIVHDFTTDCPALELGLSFGSRDVTRCFDAIAFERRVPDIIRFDNGPEFTSRAVLQYGGPWTARFTLDVDRKLLKTGSRRNGTAASPMWFAPFEQTKSQSRNLPSPARYCSF
jgi:putative transposase